MSVANFMFAKNFCMYIMLYFHQKVLQRPIPWFNQKVNDFGVLLMLSFALFSYYFLQYPAPLFAKLLRTSTTETVSKILQNIKSNWNRP